MTNNTPVILGEPACKDAGHSFFDNAQYSTDQDALNAFKDTLNNLSPELKSVCRGVGNWSTSWDYSNDFMFAKTIFPVFSKNI